MKIIKIKIIPKIQFVFFVGISSVGIVLPTVFEMVCFCCFFVIVFVTGFGIGAVGITSFFIICLSEGDL